MTDTRFRWSNRAETDPSDPRGFGTYTLPDGKEIEVPLPNFSVAFALYNALHDAFLHVRSDSRAELLNEIARIAP